MSFGRLGTWLAALATLLILAISFTSQTAAAQQDTYLSQRVSAVYESRDVREALRELFRQVGVSYTIAPEVQGRVTLSLKVQPFNQVLSNIVSQVGATWKSEDGIVSVAMLGPSEEELRLQRLAEVSPAAVVQDDHHLFIVKGNMVYKVDK